MQFWTLEEFQKFIAGMSDPTAYAAFNILFWTGIRHSHASLLINMGTDALLVQQRLGHEKVSTTLGTYAHLYPDRTNNVADRLEALAFPGEKKP